MTQDLHNALLVLEDGTVFRGHGIGAQQISVGELCFTTGMSGYQETLTDPSFAGQIITFTFPHIGNVGVNEEDTENSVPLVRGLVLRDKPTEASNWRATQSLQEWLEFHNTTGIYGIDTRALTRHLRTHGSCRAAIGFGEDLSANDLQQKAKGWAGLEGMDLAGKVTTKTTYEWSQTDWRMSEGFGKQLAPRRHVVAVDFGIKRNILRCLAGTGCKVTVVPATTSAADVLELKPDGIFLSNGPGDPAATGKYAVPMVQTLIESGKPIFGICLGHQILARALGGQTRKMRFGHRGMNQPVKDLTTGIVEITSQNHGFEVDTDSLPETVETTHISLFDGSNEGLRVKDKPIFSVQYHPEASPGPHDAHYLFSRFMEML